MNINTEHRRILVEEFRYITKRMSEAKFAEQKLYQFSATFGAVSRIFNFQCDPQLILMHLILNNAHGNIYARVQAIKGGDPVVELSEEYFDALTNCVEALASQIEKDEDTYKTLEKIASITFVTTGAGFYLFQKGILKI
jgi:hypothetical protein